ncbi:hypothetical protein SAMN05444349_1244 [Bacteroides faecichinchillae]|uniref:Uncharacterized protein n=1 Tax=Bacteroides faecichinchillae TaxID=871325 RepID=A0A1M5CEC4_9BACE|nr:hypothetical protein [Bacteroides faecichinchillae]SHF53040.1 hypothetical protein SAMN05444349_1244 [Bacteroides faecichinchillae]
MLCKYVLTIAGVSYDIPISCLKNWDEVNYSFKRSNFGGVVRTFTSKFEFIDFAYDLLLEEYLKNEFNSIASITVFGIDNNHTYSNQLFTCQLDFSTFSYDGYVVSVNSIDDSIDSLLKARKSTQYEIPVSEVKSDKVLNYDRISVFNSVKYYPYDKDFGSKEPVTPKNDEVVINYNGQTTGNTIVFPLLDGDKSEVYNSNVITLLDNFDPSNYGGLIKFNATTEVEVRMNFHVVRSSISAFSIRVVIIEGHANTTVGSFYSGNGNEFDVNCTVKVSSSYARAGNLLKIDFTADPYTSSYLKISKFKEFSIKYSSIDKPVSVDVIPPINLLKGLIKSINTEKKEIFCEIDSGVDERLDMALILAAESVRGILEAKIYTSYKKFMDWMESEFGFVQKIDGNTIRFVHRDSLFTKDIVKEIGTNHSNFSYSVDESRIYSTVSVGYEKQEYDNINGRDEFRFTTEYISGINVTTNKLELISPYRADVYGIEFLVQERGKDTTDNKSDNDVFFVGAKYDSSTDKYVLVRNGYTVTGVLNSTMMFNSMYWQRAMLEANKKFLGVFAGKLKFASSDGNSDVAVNDVALKDDFIINERLATCGIVSVETSECDIPKNSDSIITVEEGGYLYAGYYENVDVCIGRADGSKYKLIVQSVSKCE